MNLLRALVTVSGLTLISRVMGFARDFFIARAFGAGVATDAFFVAFRLPNLLRRLFAEGAFSQAFVPVLAEQKNKTSAEEVRGVIDRTATLLFLALVMTALVGIARRAIRGLHLGAGLCPRTGEVRPHGDDAAHHLPLYRVHLARRALRRDPQHLEPLFGARVHAHAPERGLHRRRAFFADHFDPPVLVLAWAVFAGGVLQLAFQVPFLYKMGLLPRWRLDLKHPAVRRVLKLMAPAAFGVSISQISLLINTIFASFLVTGSVSWLYYADRLMEFPSGMLGVALGTIILPSLSKYHADANHEEYSRLLDWGLRVTVLLAAPSAAALAVLALPLITALFQYGRFSVEDAWMTRQALMAYSVGLVGIILVKILAPGFYARQNIKTPVKIGIFTLVMTQAMNIAFIGTLKHAGLALAIGLGACLNAALLYRGLRKNGFYTPQPGWLLFMLKVAVALGLMALALFFAMGEASWWFGAPWQKKLPAVLGLVALGVLGLWRFARHSGLPAARLLAAGGLVMGVPLESFAELLARDDVRIDLAHACLMIAQDAYPKLDVERYLGEIERMAMRLRGRMPQTSQPEERVARSQRIPFRRARLSAATSTSTTTRATAT